MRAPRHCYLGRRGLRLVSRLADWVVVMAEGQVIAEGPPDSIGTNQAVIDAYLGSHHNTDLGRMDLM